MPDHVGCARPPRSVGEPLAGYGVGSLSALRVPGYGFQEVVVLEGVELHARARGDGSGTGDVAEQGDLTEEVARTEPSHVAAFFGHSNLAVRDDVEAVPGVSLADDCCPHGHLGRDEAGGDALYGWSRERSAERQGGQQPELGPQKSACRTAI